MTRKIHQPAMPTSFQIMHGQSLNERKSTCPGCPQNLTAGCAINRLLEGVEHRAIISSSASFGKQTAHKPSHAGNSNRFLTSLAQASREFITSILPALGLIVKELLILIPPTP